jgi:hypothetical protein
MKKNIYILFVCSFCFLLIFPTAYLKAQGKINLDSLSSAKHVYAPLRYDEDWSYLKDATLRTEGLDKLKFIPLNKSKAGYITLGGESRLRFEYFHNENLGASPDTDNGYFQQRSFLHADVHLSEHFRVFTQLNSSTTSFRQGGPRPIFDKDVLDVNQAFFDISFGDQKKNFTLRTGRQELHYGNGKLVEPREGPNQRLAFDAIRMIVKTKAVNIETFVAQPVINKQNTFDNTGDSNTTFWGIYSSLASMKGFGFDVYYFGIKNKMASFEKGSGEEVRHTFGFKFNGRYKKLDYETENFFQTGTFSNYNIAAWGSTVSFNYKLPAQLLKSTIGIGASISSGDNGMASNKLGTFNALFPTGFYFGPPALPIGPANLKAVRVSLTSVLLKNLLFMPSWGVFWRNNVNDGIYTPASTLYRSGNSSNADYIGNQLNMVLLLKVNPHVTFMTSYALFSAGNFIKETGASKNVSYVNADLTFKF